MWGAPKWPPTPPSARRAPAEPWRASVSGLNRLDRARFAQRLDLLRVVAQEAAQHLACVLTGTVRCGARGRGAPPVHHEGHAGDAHALARAMRDGGKELALGEVRVRDDLGRREHRRRRDRSEEHTSELQSLAYLVCRLLLEKKKKKKTDILRSLRIH